MKKNITIKTIEDDEYNLTITELPAKGLVNLIKIIKTISIKMQTDPIFANSFAGLQIMLANVKRNNTHSFEVQEYLHIIPVILCEFSEDIFPALAIFTNLEESILEKLTLETLITLTIAIFECNDFEKIINEIKNSKGLLQTMKAK